MPPLLFSVLSYPMTRLAHVLFPTAMANAVIAGAFVFCTLSSPIICPGFDRILLDVLYDITHYA